MLTSILKRTLAVGLLISPFLVNCQDQTWPNTLPESWPTIALTNHVRFKNGDTYVHHSVQYAGTGFVIDFHDRKLAVTAKHVLWVARNKEQNTVTVNENLDQWVMKVKEAPGDSVVIDRLLNEDRTEILEGPGSTILERDILVFSILSAGPGIKPLIPRSSDVQPGEKVFVIGNPYHETKTVIYETRVVRKLGMDILLEQNSNGQYAGFSGSPVIDANGFVIGVFSSMSSDPVTQKGVIVLTSMEYIKAFLEGKADVNTPKEDYGTLLLEAVLKENVKTAIKLFEQLTSDPRNYYKYNLRSAARNGLLETGEKLIEMNRLKDAIGILEFNAKVNNGYFHNYNVLAKAYLKSGDRKKAIEFLRISTTKFDDKEENEAFKLLEELQN
jgi:hypothetical protein